MRRFLGRSAGESESPDHGLTMVLILGLVLIVVFLRGGVNPPGPVERPRLAECSIWIYDDPGTRGADVGEWLTDPAFRKWAGESSKGLRVVAVGAVDLLGRPSQELGPLLKFREQSGGGLSGLPVVCLVDGSGGFVAGWVWTGGVEGLKAWLGSVTRE